MQSSSLRHTLFGKYREIVIAVACFLLFDLGVLLLNFYTSFQIAEDALAINLSGRQRMLSQRMAKSALTLDGDLRRGENGRAAADELRGAVTLFDSTLDAFIKGGEVTGADGKPVRLKAVRDAQGQRVLAEALDLWVPYKEALLGVGGGTSTHAAAERAAQAARVDNQRLLKLMNDLTVRLEAVASTKAERLRWVQTIGIVLALINFMFILFKFLRRLDESDAKTEAAQRETAEILATVREGLFLIDRDFRLGSQYSASLAELLGRPVAAGSDFAAMLRDMLSSEDYGLAVDYARLLMGDRVKEALVRDLNPLREVAVTVGEARRHLSFEFTRVVVAGQLKHLLVTVTDVSELMMVRAELEAMGKQAEQQLSVLMQLVQMQPAVLLGFVNETEAALLDVNDRLRAVEGRAGEYRRLVEHVFRRVHGVKGNAAALGLDFMASDCEAFESALAAMRGRETISGDELIGISVHLQGMFERLGWLREMTGRFADNSATRAPDVVGFEHAIANLTARVAADHSKSVVADVDLGRLHALPAELASAVRTIASQLVRNAVVHGIESPQERAAKGKRASGSLRVALAPAGDARFALSVRDDGRGLSAEELRIALLKSGRYTEEALAQLSDRQVIMEIFRPGFTTADQAGVHAGRGVGLDAVADAVRRLGGQLKLATQPGKYTEFRVEFAA